MLLAEKQQGRGDIVPTSLVRTKKRISAVAKRSRLDLCSAQPSFAVKKD